MAAVINIIAQLLADFAQFVVLQFRPMRSVQAENLFLRRQLGLFKERGVKPRRVDAATRISLAVLSRLFDWRDALVVVQPKTIIRWQRAGWRLFWRWKCRPGRPRIPVELRALIRRMALENPIWGEERIASELLRAWQSQTETRRCHGAPERGLDIAATARSRRRGEFTPLSAS